MEVKRQRECIAKANREGRYKGRVPTAPQQSAEKHPAEGCGHLAVGIAVRLGIGLASVYRVLGEQERVAA
jgi:hypothetical protein